MKNNILISLAILISALTVNLEAVSVDKLNEIISATRNPFDYDLHLTMVPSDKQDSDLLISLHGMGSDYSLVEILKSNPALPYHIVGFNFPDYRLSSTNIMKTTFGTFEELASALFVLKRLIVDGGVDKVHLYGFSAGGGVIINALAILNSNRYDESLQKFGIGLQEKQRILKSIQKGTIILEVPLKSFDEIADSFASRDMKMLARRAQSNGMTPMENLSWLQGLSLQIFIFFAYPDEALGNRDDEKFIQRLKHVNNKGQTIAIIRSGGHTTFHSELWETYKKFIKSNRLEE